MTPLFAAIRANCLAIAMQDLCSRTATVQHDATGLPIAWRLFPFGPITITRDGVRAAGTFTADHADSILAFAADKGTPVPIDAHHALFHLAQQLGLEESQLAAAGVGSSLAVGFGQLAKRPDGLWLTDVQWTDIGAKLIRAGAFRYFSPVLRGNADGRYRVTSTALTNNPAFNGLDAIAAESDDHMTRDILRLSDLPQPSQPQPKGNAKNMNTLLDKLQALLGLPDAIALADDGTPPDGLTAAIDALAGRLPVLQAAATGLAAVRDALALDADADPAAIQGALAGILAKAGQHDTIAERVAALEADRAAADRTAVIAKGIAQGKLTQALVDGWCKGQDATALEAFLQFAPVIVPPGQASETRNLPNPDDVTALTADQLEVAEHLGMTPEQMIAAIKDTTQA